MWERSFVVEKLSHRQGTDKREFFCFQWVMTFLSQCNQAWVASEMLPASASHFTESWSRGKCLADPQHDRLPFLFSWGGRCGEKYLYNIKTLYLHFFALQFMKHVHMQSCLLSAALLSPFVMQKRRPWEVVTLLLVTQGEPPPLKSSGAWPLPSTHRSLMPTAWIHSAAVTTCHRLGGLPTTGIYFSQFWRLGVWDQSGSLVG